MPYTPPFRTRRSSQRLVEPHIGESNAPSSDTLKTTLTWTTASARPLADDVAHAPSPPAVDDDDDALPVLTQLIEPPPAPVVEMPAPQPAAEAAAEPEAVDEELVGRITDEVLDALQPVLHDLVGNAVRRALEDRIRQGGKL